MGWIIVGLDGLMFHYWFGQGVVELMVVLDISPFDVLASSLSTLALSITPPVALSNCWSVAFTCSALPVTPLFAAAGSRVW